MSNPYSAQFDENPFASPLATDDPVAAAGDVPEAEAIRRKYINHEASVRSIGILYYLGCALFVVGLGSVAYSTLRDGSLPGPAQTGFLVVTVAYTLVLGGVGWGTRRLRRWARIAGILLATLVVLLSIFPPNPISWLINGYILWLLGSAKGKYVFSDEYQDVRAATPHIKYKTSKVVWALLITVVVLLVVAVGAALTG